MEIATTQYNEKRFGSPWAARVHFDENGNMKMAFCKWVGDKGHAGKLLLGRVKEGDIFAFGQKDYRQPKNGSGTKFYIYKGNEWHQLSKKQAYDEYFKPAQKEDVDKLKDEKARILERLEEINIQLMNQGQSV
jgi:hypothetical protein